MGNEIRNLKARMTDLYTCGRCSGRGSLVEYVNYNGGVCFECQGAGHCLPRGRRDRAVYTKLAIELATLEALKAAEPHVATEDMNDPDTLDLRALLGGAV